MRINQVKTNPFIESLNSTQSISNTKKVQTKSSRMYKDTYILEISAKGIEYQKLYEHDEYPIINDEVFSYKKNLEIIYKDVTSFFRI